MCPEVSLDNPGVSWGVLECPVGTQTHPFQMRWSSPAYFTVHNRIGLKLSNAIKIGATKLQQTNLNISIKWHYIPICSVKDQSV